MNYKEIVQKLSQRLLLTVTFELVFGLLISLGALWGFAELSQEIFEGETHRLDIAILLWVDSTFPAWLGQPMRLITALGYPWMVAPLLLLATYILYRKNLKLATALLVVSVPGAAILGIALKSFYQRERPDLFDLGYTAPFFSFPSGHAITAISFYGVLTLLTARRLGGWRRWTVAATGAVLVLLIGFSRLYFGVHYPSDIVAGYLSATIWVGTVGAAFILWRSLRKHRY